MGRGRAKAKQTKVARQLKYQSLDTDLDALQRELSNGETSHVGPAVDDDEEDDDPYAVYVDDEDEPTR